MKRATYEDVLNAPENMVAEILDGELVLSPRPAFPHAHLGEQIVGPRRPVARPCARLGVRGAVAVHRPHRSQPEAPGLRRGRARPRRPVVVSTLEDISYHLYVRAKVEEGLAALRLLLSAGTADSSGDGRTAPSE
jgi:hypothetical protein